MSTYAELVTVDPDTGKASKTMVKLLDAPTSERSRTLLWVMILVILAGTIFLFGAFAFNQIAHGGDPTALLTLATTALGLIGGLFVRSPIQG